MDNENEIQNERLNRKETALRLIPLLVLSILFLISGIILYHSQFTGISVLTIFIQALVAGFGEELIFRLLILGLCFKFLKESRHLPAVIIVSFVFGLAHFSNLRGGSFEFSMVLLQVISAALGGLVFGLMYYNARSYLLCAGVHFIYDLGVFFLSVGIGNLMLAGPMDLVSEILIMALCALTAFTLLKKDEKILRIGVIAGLFLAFVITVLKVISYSNLNV